jgi:mRNA interferase MazF
LLTIHINNIKGAVMTVNQVNKTVGYMPERGDAVWISLDPQAGHEQAGRRPALVLSPASYNGKVGLCIVCPITSQVKPYPFVVSIPQNLGISGVILADQAKSLDWQARRVQFIEKLPDEIVDDVLAKLSALLGL